VNLLNPTTGSVVVYDTNTFQQVATLATGLNLADSGNNAYGDGWMRISPNGDLLAVSIETATGTNATELFNVSAFSAVPEPGGLVLGLTAFALVASISLARKKDVGAGRSIGGIG
jgi:hypothetical protein